jgi:hypothetical protein
MASAQYWLAIEPGCQHLANDLVISRARPLLLIMGASRTSSSEWG